MALQKTLTFTISGGCNLACSYCVLTYHKKFLTLETIKQELSKYNKDDIYVILSGGEPTINPEFIDILTYLEDNEYTGQVITNGININKFLPYFKKFRINLSLSSLNISKFDDKDFSTWKAITQIIAKHPLKNKALSLSPVFKNDFEETKLLLDFAKQNDIGVTMNVFTQYAGEKEAFYHKRTPNDLEQLRKMIDYYTEIYDPQWWIEPSSLEEYYEYYSQGKFQNCIPRLQMTHDLHFMPTKDSKGYEFSACCLFDKKDEESLASCGGCLDICQIQNKRDWTGKRETY